ncbi:RnfABCDGE type electron transport complex subunit G [bacterium]|nr:RnfABCDGE type electron transport complex subunit G [bacterium]
MKKVLQVGMSLTFICSISAAILSFVYQKTKPLIDLEREKSIKIAQKEVLPRAVTFETNKIKEREFSIGYNDGDQQEGIVMNVSVKGYSGKIDMIVGVNNEREISGLKVLQHTETPGLGAKITRENFLKQFYGNKDCDLVLKKESPSGKIDAITGATISSRAVTMGTKKCLNWVNENYYLKDK